MNINQLLVGTILAMTADSAAQAHPRLESSQPKAESVLESSPKQLRLQFNEPLEPAFSKLRLTDAANADVAVSSVGLDKSNRSMLVADVPVLRAGQYRVQWSAVGHDGHKIKGEFGFKVK